MKKHILGIIFGLALAASSSGSTGHVMGVCQVIPNAEEVPPTLENSIGPVYQALSYLKQYMGKSNLEYDDVKSLAIVTILEQPAHGVLTVLDNKYAKKIIGDPSAADGYDGSNTYIYLPSKNYFGRDKVAVIADVKGYGKIKIIYFLYASNIGGTGGDEGVPGDPCKANGGAFKEWKISQTTPTSIDSTLLRHG